MAIRSIGNPVARYKSVWSETGLGAANRELYNAPYLAWTNYNGERGVWGGGYASGYQNTMDYVAIASTGDAQDFGDLTTARRENAACSNGTRGVWGGGREPDGSTVKTMDYVTIGTTGNATDFGDLANAMKTASATSNGTRGVYWVDLTINYITIASAGNAIDFGDYTSQAGNQGVQWAATVSNNTRAVTSGGRYNATGVFNLKVYTRPIAGRLKLSDKAYSVSNPITEYQLKYHPKLY